MKYRFQFVLLILVIANFINVGAKNDFENGLLEQSLLYGIATAPESAVSDNRKCDNEFKKFSNAVYSRETWALKMLDASGQEESGYLSANFLWMGSLTLCQNIPSNAPYEVKYVSVLLKHNNTMQIQLNFPNNDYLQLGLCVPKSCSNYDIQIKLNKVLQEKQLNFLVNYPMELSFAKIKSLDYESNTWANSSIVTSIMFAFTITIILSILGTWYDITVRQPHLKYIEKQKKTETTEFAENKNSPIKMFGEDTWWSKILLCYSMPANIKSLFDTNIKAEDSLPAVHGLKTFGMFYIVFVHYPLYNSMTSHNLISIVRYSTAWYFQLFFKSAFSVDTYFCLGGFLISYIFFKTHKDGKSYNFFQGIKVLIQMMLHRIIRLLPAYVVTISLVVTIWRWMEYSYPIFRVLDSAEEICPKYWWRNLLFITTWHPRSEMCITWTWYLSEDIQFYLVNCALLILATKYLKPVIYFTKLMVLYSIIYTAWLSYTIEYIPTVASQMLMEVMYYSFSVRMAPYFVGMIAGYYFQTWGGKLPLSKNGIYKGWLLFILNALFIVQVLPYPNKAPFAFVVFYSGVTRALWGAGIAWLLMACLSGHGGIINKMLSFKGWIPFSRTTFCVYLTNLIVVNAYGYSGEQASYFSVTHQLTFLVGNIVLCFIFGLVFSILFESPFVQLIKLLMTPGKKTRNTEQRKQIKKSIPTDFNSNYCPMKEKEYDENNYILIRC